MESLSTEEVHSSSCLFLSSAEGRSLRQSRLQQNVLQFTKVLCLYYTLHYNEWCTAITHHVPYHCIVLCSVIVERQNVNSTEEPLRKCGVIFNVEKVEETDTDRWRKVEFFHLLSGNSLHYRSTHQPARHTTRTGKTYQKIFISNSKNLFYLEGNSPSHRTTHPPHAQPVQKKKKSSYFYCKFFHLY